MNPLRWPGPDAVIEIATGRMMLTVTLPEPAERIVAVTTDQFVVLASGYLIAADAAGPTRATASL